MIQSVFKILMILQVLFSATSFAETATQTDAAGDVQLNLRRCVSTNQATLSARLCAGKIRITLLRWPCHNRSTPMKDTKSITFG